ncbi:MAG: sugar transferase [Flavobacteriales bacterium]|nr:sugar transferase [Flavobacteriales bacterium]
MSKRIFDIVFSLFFLCIALPLFLPICIWVLLDAGWPVFFSQERVGKNGQPFRLLKFRTMHRRSEKTGQLTVGSRDSRITKSGFHLRKYKLDELPQLFNVLIGDMSLVGPRPEVPRYVAAYNEEQKKVLRVKPGITDHASLLYFEEAELLAKSPNPEEMYLNEIMPAKLKLNLEYIQNQNFTADLVIIFKTIGRMIS